MRRPSREELLRFLADAPRKVGKRDVSRAFGLTKHDNEWIGEQLRELAGEGHVQRSSGHRSESAAAAEDAENPPAPQPAHTAIPSVAVLQIIQLTPDRKSTRLNSSHT